MTFSIVNIFRVAFIRIGVPIEPNSAVLPTYDSWPRFAQRAYLILVHSYAQHATEFIVALAMYFLLWPLTMPHAASFQTGWILKVVAFNIMLEMLTYGFWHAMMYAGQASTEDGPLRQYKYNPRNQYEPTGPVGHISSSTGHLQREVSLTTLGWLQASVWEILVMHAYATGYLTASPCLWRHVALWIVVGSWWRDAHFYFIHRLIHPWTARGAVGKPPPWDLGAFLYRHVHALHHASYNPGPWSGLAMHPVEHFIYFSCVLLPLPFHAHPLAFLYILAHALVSPVGGHDGYAKPGGGGGAHYLHHAHMEINYGVSTATPMDFDTLFGSNLSWDVSICCRTVAMSYVC